ncbi:uncharacterized protein LOC131228197 isoform X2 [Magnolia sinica]|uniref:uncharacterized protein LOC131228197 isoform X2 n=1 Tax=Magnolia sinica TaxID=86752 RepID=UPI002658804A|nr:uncharacterized protein LOC131228197 isoform X2 [Magnolia sinica]
MGLPNWHEYLRVCKCSESYTRVAEPLSLFLSDHINSGSCPPSIIKARVFLPFLSLSLSHQAQKSTIDFKGSRPESSPFPHSTESHFTAGASAVSNSFGSPSPLSESDQLESSRTPPISFPQRNFSGRRSFMSKPVYPLVFRNPVSDNEVCRTADMASGSRSTPGENPTLSLSPDGTANLALKKMEASPDPSSSSRREGFRWSNASSYDMGFDGDIIDITDHMDSGNVKPACNSTADQKCGLCGRLLSQKSPWSSYRIVRTGDMPIAGVLSCSHVFHAECLDQTTPKTQIHDPPCPMCQKVAGGAESSLSISEPLQMALRSIRRNQGISITTDGEGTSSRQSSDQTESGLRRNRSLPMVRRGGSSLIKNHFKKHFSFNGVTGKDLFGVKMFRRTGSSSAGARGNEEQVGC